MSSDSDEDLWLPGASKGKATSAAPALTQTPTATPAATSLALPPSAGGGGDGVLAARRRGMMPQVAKRDPFAPAGTGSAVVTPAQSSPLTPPLQSPQRDARGSVSFVQPERSRSVSRSREEQRTHPAASSSPGDAALPAPVAVTAAPPPSLPPAVDAEVVARLREQVAERRLYLQTLKEKEKDIVAAQQQATASHEATIEDLEGQIRAAWADVDAERARLDHEVREAEADQERILRAERRRVEDDIKAQTEPEVRRLEETLQGLRSKKAELQQALNVASAGGDVVSSAIAAAVQQLAGKVRDAVEAQLPKGDEWERRMRGIVQKEMQGSFASAAASDAEAELSDYQKAFEDVLTFWREMEGESKEFVARLDRQLMDDLKSTAIEDMRRIQGEEQRVQEVYVEAREAWARYHRATLREELEQALQRRSAEFESLRSSRHAAHVELLTQIERQHHDASDARKQLHERELQLIRDTHQQREGLHAERATMQLQVQEDAAKATQALAETVKGVHVALLNLEQYRLAVDDGRSALDAERKRSLQHRQSTLEEIQGMVLAQANAVEAERKTLAASLVKLDVVQRSVETQLEEERVWVAQMGSKLERSRADWDREYRRWQQVSQQEKLAAEERFAGVLTELRKTSALLDQQANDLEVEEHTQRRHAADRAAKQSAQLEDLQAREADLSQRQEQMQRALADLESKGRAIAQQWEDLHRERQQLAVQRDELRGEEIRMEHLSDHLRVMRSQLDSTQAEVLRVSDRNRASQHRAAVAKEVVDDNMRQVHRDSERLLAERTALERDERRITDGIGRVGSQPMSLRGPSAGGDDNRALVPGSRPSHHAVRERDPSRLPQQLLSELRGALSKSLTGGNFGESIPPPPPRELYARHSHNRHASSSVAETSSSYSTSGGSVNASALLNAAHRDPSSMYFTRLLGMSEFETTSVSQARDSSSS